MPHIGEVLPAVNKDVQGRSLNMTVSPASPSSTEDAGTLKLLGQDATGATKNGGAVEIISGNGASGGYLAIIAGNGSISAGELTLAGGAGSGVNSNGGSLYLNGGAATGTGAPGDVFFSAGAGTTHGGSIHFSGGNTGGDAITVTDNGTVEQVAFFGVTPVAQPTTSTASSTFVANTGTAINSASTFDGYTIAKVVKALRNLGILA